MDDDKRVKGFHSDLGFGPTDHPEVRPLPFRLMAVGDFCGAGHDRTRGALRIDAHDFDQVMAGIGARARCEVENLIGAPTDAGEPAMTLQVDIELTSLKSFDEAHVAASIPALATLREFVRCARGVADGSVAPAEFERGASQFRALPVLREPLQAVLDRLNAASRPPARRDEPPLDAHLESIFAMVDVPKGPSERANVDRAADGAERRSEPGIDVSCGIALAEAALARQLRAVTEHGAFQRLERNWRGLRLLCRRGKGAQIELFDGDFDGWRERVFESEYAGTSPAPLSLVVACDPIENSAMGMHTLQQWAEAGEQIQCGVVFDAGRLPGEEMQALARRDAPSHLFDDARFDQWRSLRDKDASRWLCAALNGCVLRPATSRPGEPQAPPLWGSPVWLVAAAVAQSMQRTGWPSAHTGMHDGEIEQLPIHTHADGTAHALETLLNDRALRDLAKAGFTPLTCKANHDSAWVMLAPTVHRPGKNEQDARRGTLAHQLLAARIGEMIVRNKAALVVPGDMQRSADNFARFLSGLLADTGPGAAIDIGSEHTTLVLAIRTGSHVLGGTELQLGVDIG